MPLRFLLVFFVCHNFGLAAEPTFLSLPGSSIILTAPNKWTIVDKDEEIGMYSPDQASQGLQSRIHLSRYLDEDKSLQGAIQAEIDRVTAKSPYWGSGCDRLRYKGNTPVETISGIKGLRANFYSDFEEDHLKRRAYTIVKYYFFDEYARIFRVCSHVYGDESQFKKFDQAILEGLKFIK